MADLNFASLSSILVDYKTGIDSVFLVLKIDIHGNILYANKKFCTFCGFSLNRLQRKSYTHIHDEYSRHILDSEDDTLNGMSFPHSDILSVKKRDGTFHPFKSFISLTQDNHYLIIYYEELTFLPLEQSIEPFKYVIEHEIKTPLNAIISFSDYIYSELKYKDVNFEELLHAIKNIRKESFIILDKLNLLFK